MKRRLDVQKVKAFKSRVGRDCAIYAVKSCLECSISKAEKFVDGKPSGMPPAAEQVLLAELLGYSRDELFRVVSRPSEKAS